MEKYHVFIKDVIVCHAMSVYDYSKEINFHIIILRYFKEVCNDIRKKSKKHERIKKAC